MTSVYMCSPFLDVYINNGFPELWNENVSTGYIWIFPNIQKTYLLKRYLTSENQFTLPDTDTDTYNFFPPEIVHNNYMGIYKMNHWIT